MHEVDAARSGIDLADGAAVPAGVDVDVVSRLPAMQVVLGEQFVSGAVELISDGVRSYGRFLEPVPREVVGVGGVQAGGLSLMALLLKRNTCSVT